MRPDPLQLTKAFLYLDSTHKKKITADDYVKTCLECEQNLERKIAELEENLNNYRNQLEKLSLQFDDLDLPEKINEFGILEDSQLNIQIIEVRGFFPRDLRTNMSLYAAVRVGSQQMLTNSAETTLDPVWNAEFSFNIFTGKEKIRIELFDLMSANSQNFEAYSEIYVNNLYDQQKHDIWLDLKGNKNENVSGRLHISAQWIHSKVKYFTDIIGKIKEKMENDKNEQNVLKDNLSKLQEPYGFFKYYNHKNVESQSGDSPSIVLLGNLEQAEGFQFHKLSLPKPSKGFMKFDNLLWMVYAFSSIISNYTRNDIVNTTAAVLGLATNALVIGKEIEKLVKLGLFMLTLAIMFDAIYISFVGKFEIHVTNLITWMNLGLKLGLFSRMKKKLKDAKILAMFEPQKLEKTKRRIGVSPNIRKKEGKYLEFHDEIDSENFDNDNEISDESESEKSPVLKWRRSNY